MLGIQVNFSGRYTRLDVYHACSMLFGISWPVRILALIVVLPLGFAICLDFLSGSSSPELFVSVVGGLPLFLPFLWWIFWALPHLWQSPFLRTSAGDCEVSVDDKGIFIVTQEHYEERPWGSISRWSENGYCFMLNLNTGRYDFFPKRLFSSREEIQAFRTMLEDHLTRPPLSDAA